MSMEEKDEFSFTLSKPIKYAHQGTQKEGQMLVLRGPSLKLNQYRIKLQQAFFRCINSARKGGENPQEGGDEKITGSAVLSLMLMSDVDMFPVHEDFKRLLVSGACLIEGEEKLTETLYLTMNPNDVDRLFGEYMAVFIVASVLENLKEK